MTRSIICIGNLPSVGILNSPDNMFRFRSRTACVHSSNSWHTTSMLPLFHFHCTHIRWEGVHTALQLSLAVLVLDIVIIATIYDTRIILYIWLPFLNHHLDSFGGFCIYHRFGCMRKWTFMQKVPRGHSPCLGWAWAFSAPDTPGSIPHHVAEPTTTTRRASDWHIFYAP